MTETSDIPYHVLEARDQQHLRLATLRAACDRVSNFIAGLDIFPLYSFDPEVLYGSVGGQKFAAADPTVKARYSRKYFSTGKGVVAYHHHASEAAPSPLIRCAIIRYARVGARVFEQPVRAASALVPCRTSSKSCPAPPTQPQSVCRAPIARTTACLHKAIRRSRC